MAGYTRQSVADIVANAVIKAAPVNAEYNAIRDAFTHASGHKHDGTSTEGAFIPLISDVDSLNKVVVDTANNRIGFFVQVSTGTVEQLRIQDGAIVPVTDSDIDLGASGAEFKDLYIDGIGYIDTIAVHENATIAGTLGVTGLSTLATVDINGGNIDGTVIGAATPAAATVTSLVATTADINGGTIDGSTIAGGSLNNAAIGNSTASTVVGTTVTANNFVGPIAGAVTGNVTGNTAGVHTGAVTGDVTGNITAGSGSSSFTNVTINGSLDMNAGTSSTITGLSTPVQNSDAATKAYVDGVVAATVDSAPAALDTLNELAAALGDDANYAATTTTALGTKLPKSGGTMTGAIAMGTSKITGLGTPTAGTDAATKSYVDGPSGAGAKLNLSGGTMSGVLAMGANKITGVANPTTAQDATTKNYVDTILGSSTAAATSASNAATSESNAAGSATASANSATASGNSASAAATSLATFTGQYVSQSSAPSSPSTGDLWFDTSASIMKVYNGSGWVAAGSAVSGTDNSVQYTATANQTTFNATYDTGSVQVYLNGVRLDVGDYTATNGSSIVLDIGATVGDTVFIHSFGTFLLADHYSKTASDARFAPVSASVLATNALPKSGGAMTGAITTNSTFDGRNVSVDGTKLDTIPVISTASTASFIAKGSSGQDGYIQLNCEVNSHGIKLKSPPHSAGASYTLVFPNDDGNNGQFLTSNGSGVMSWTSADTSALLPLSGGAMTGAITTNSTFDGVDIATRDAVLTSTTTTANAALPKAGGALTGAVTTNSTFDGVDIATRDAVLTSTTTTASAALPKAGGTMTGAAIGAVVALTDASSIATNLALGNNYSVTLAGNRTLANPTNTVAGQSGSIFITQDGTGSRTLAYGANFKFVGGTAPTLSTAAASVDRIDYVVASATKIHAVASLDVK